MIMIRKHQFNIIKTGYKLFSSFFNDLNPNNKYRSNNDATKRNLKNDKGFKSINNESKSNSNFYKRSIFKSQKQTPSSQDLSTSSITINKNYLVKSFTRFRFDKRDFFRLFDFNYF